MPLPKYQCQKCGHYSCPLRSTCELCKTRIPARINKAAEAALWEETDNAPIGSKQAQKLQKLQSQPEKDPR